MGGFIRMPGEIRGKGAGEVEQGISEAGVEKEGDESVLPEGSEGSGSGLAGPWL
jgi:hypothetical protein